MVLLRKQAAPEAARLLPEADAVLYVDFGTVRNLTAFDQHRFPSSLPAMTSSSRTPALPLSAISTKPPWPSIAAPQKTPRTALPAIPRFSSATTTRSKLAQYLRQHSRSVENYRDVDVFSIPIENRTLRVALLAIDTVAVSNVEDPEVVHGIIDRFKKVALPFGGPTLVHTYYPKVPLGSLLWAIARIPDSSNNPHAAPSFTLPGGIDIGLPGNSDVVVSLRMLTTIHARADFYTQSEEAARNFTNQSTTFLAIFRSIQANAAPGPGDPDVKAVFDSIKVTQKGDRAEVIATIPPSFLRKLVNEPARNVVQGETTPGAPDKK